MRRSHLSSSRLKSSGGRRSVSQATVLPSSALEQWLRGQPEAVIGIAFISPLYQIFAYIFQLLICIFTWYRFNIVLMVCRAEQEGRGKTTKMAELEAASLRTCAA